MPDLEPARPRHVLVAAVPCAPRQPNAHRPHGVKPEPVNRGEDVAGAERDVRWRRGAREVAGEVGGSRGEERVDAGPLTLDQPGLRELGGGGGEGVVAVLKRYGG